VLGDSFANIYSSSDLGWGTGAGFVETLSYLLQRPVDRITRNGDGAYATRQELARQLRREDETGANHDRLNGKQLVIYQFAMRELQFGQWRELRLRSFPKAMGDATGLRKVRGEVAAITKPPPPRTVPYPDAIIAMHLMRVENVSPENLSLENTVIRSEIVVFAWGMRENQWTSAARVSVGDSIEMNLRPWSDVENQYGRFARIELDDPELRLIDLPTYWSDEMTVR
jgi:alginate O-acetyltransferase complex protein AlgJ